MCGGPSVKWYQLQQQLFGDAKFDVLLLLDCCYAGLAGRGPVYIPPGPVELLAAAGDTVTPSPGDKSFTTIMIAVMKKHLEEYGQIRISDLHAKLVHRRADAFALPFHVNLREGPSERSILLEPLDTAEERGPIVSLSKTAVDLTIGLSDAPEPRRLDTSIHLLRSEPQRAGIAQLRVNRVLRTTGKLHKFMEETFPEKQNPIVRSLEKPSLDQIGHAWSALQS
jgi:hypothetical protein